MKIVEPALAILQKFLPSLTLKSFLQKIRPIVEQYRNLSPEEIKFKVLEYIRNEQPFGEEIAEGAKYALGEGSISEEEKEVIRTQLAQGEYGDIGLAGREVINFSEAKIHNTESPIVQEY